MEKETLEKASKLYQRKSDLDKQLSSLILDDSVICYNRNNSGFLCLNYGINFEFNNDKEFMQKLKDMCVNKLKEEISKVDKEIEDLKC